MVFRYLCRCMTCGKAHTLRIAMGHSPIQHHTFHCVGCGEEMSIEVVQLRDTASCDIKCVVNCEHWSEEGIIINLHPDFPIPEDQLHQDRAFPWLGQMSQITKNQEESGPAFPGFNSIAEYKQFIAEHPHITENWTVLKKAWSLERNGRSDLSSQELKKYLPVPEGSGSEPRLAEVLFDFTGKIITIGRASVFQDALSLVEKIAKQHPEELKKFRNFYKETMHQEGLDRYFDVFSEYFRDFGEFTQTLVLVQYKVPLPEDSAVSSTAFSRTKMLYGNVFEAMSSQFAVLACLNNVLNGRPFDRFQSMDLEKYLTIHKAKRAVPFADTPEFAVFAETLDSTLRNSSHHGSFKLDHNMTTIRYSSGGTGAMRQMRYSEYLYRCNEEVLKMAALLRLELVLAL